MLLASASYNNGNATTDGLKNLQTTYNILNLPQKVSQSGTTKTTYTWFADGSKYSTLDNAGNGYHYIGSLIYNTSANTTTTLESTDFSQGRIALSGNTQTINYHHRDHLGSVRAITNGSGTVIEQNSYYPFGGRHNFGITNTPTSANRYKFNGKEEQTIGSLDLLDYGARMYDTKTARWLVQDPLAEKYYSFSAYNYCVNNPVSSIDIEGKRVIFINGFPPYPFELGKSNYWGKFDDKALSVLGEPIREEPIYLDGSLGGYGNFICYGIDPNNFPHSIFAENRYNEGYMTGLSSVKGVIQSLLRDSDGNIIEPITVIAYSMGTVYSKGYLQAFIEYIGAHPDECKGLYISEYNFGAYQADSYDAVEGVNTFQFNNERDRLNKGKIIPGAKVKILSSPNIFPHRLTNYEQFIEYITKENPSVKVRIN